MNIFIVSIKMLACKIKVKTYTSIFNYYGIFKSTNEAADDAYKRFGILINVFAEPMRKKS